jgi:SPOR domain
LVLFLAPRQILAQRFTSSGPSLPVMKTDTIADDNARLAYNALKAGNVDDARDYLDDADPQDPYAMFVRAALTEDAVTASNMYKEIIAENEGTRIAREALIQLYKYHYAAGEYNSAHRDYVELKKFSVPPGVPDPLGLRDSLQALPVSPAQQSPETPQTDVSAASHPPVYLVQVGVFTTADNARKFVQSLKMYDVTGTLFTKSDGGRTLYGVSAGSFSSRDAAEDMAANLKSRSIDCIVVQR